jgi:hypothetical protein
MLASLRRRHKKVCPVCGTEFVGIANRVYDRPACQTRAYRLRQKKESDDLSLGGQAAR